MKLGVLQCTVWLTTASDAMLILYYLGKRDFQKRRSPARARRLDTMVVTVDLEVGGFPHTQNVGLAEFWVGR